MHGEYRANDDLMANRQALQRRSASPWSFRAGAPALELPTLERPRHRAPAPMEPLQIRGDPGDFPQRKPECVGNERTPAALGGRRIAAA